jgi:hypothetical protein
LDNVVRVYRNSNSILLNADAIEHERLTEYRHCSSAEKCEQPEVGEEVARELESAKHFLWHGNTFQALQRLEGLLIDLEFPAPLTQKVAKGIFDGESGKWPISRATARLSKNLVECRRRIGRTM